MPEAFLYTLTGAVDNASFWRAHASMHPARSVAESDSSRVGKLVTVATSQPVLQLENKHTFDH